MAVLTFSGNEPCATKNAQQSVHLTLGILRTSQAVSHALSFFLAGRLRRPRPSAGNANRWAVPCKVE